MDHKSRVGCRNVTAFLVPAATDTGEGLYGEHCASCHAATLRGSAHGAALYGPAFADKWSGVSVNLSRIPDGGDAT